MDLHTDTTFWPKKNGIPFSFPQLKTNQTCDVVIIGGGITGALIAEAFISAGIQTIVVDKRKIGHGSTSASTALLQYEIDEMLFSLQKMIGKANAIEAYKLCEQSIFTLKSLIDSYNIQCGFLLRPSLYFTQKKKDLSNLKKEFKAREEAGFAVKWINQQEIQKEYGFKAYAGIYSMSGGQVDPYCLAYNLLNVVNHKNGKVFQETNIQDIQTEKNVILTAENGCTITAKKCIFAVGFEAKNYLKEKTATLLSTYACISKPIKKKVVWKDNCLLWNTEDPYFYARFTEDQRFLIGGEDVEFVDEKKRDARVKQKTKKLIHTFHSFFPEYTFELETAWAGTFGETEDALPYIGISPEWKNTYFALGYGGNGITFSVIAADALLQLYQGRKPTYLPLFQFGR